MIALTLALHAGCDPGAEAEDDEEDAVDFRPIGGVWLNTSAIGPMSFSQIDLNGQALDGLVLTDVFLKRPGNHWLRMDSVEIVGGRLRGRRGNMLYSGADLVDSRWRLSPVQGAPVEIWISAYTVISATQARYTFKISGTDGVATHVCDPDLDGDRSAIPIKDLTVDHQTGDMATRAGTMFLACLSGAVGKAFKWGYDPAASVPYFEAAVRMVRADYCYDGGSWTTVGTSMQVLDTGDPGPFVFPNNATEAVWTRTGLACLTQPRWTVYSAPEVQCDGATIPTCPTNVDMSTYPETLFWTKLGGAQPL